MGLALGEAAHAKPRLAGGNHFVADHPRSTRDGLAPESVVSLLADTGLVANRRDAAAIVAESCRLLKGPSEASCWPGSRCGFGSRPLGSK